nr:putative integron gene cassette protein [uncultured bacterium]
MDKLVPGAGTGFFSHLFVARCDFCPELDESTSTWGSITVKATRPAQPMLWGHVSPKYSHAKIEWSLFHEKESNGNATIDLEQMQITRNGEVTSLDAENLSHLLGIFDATDHEIVRVETLFDFLQAAKNGDLPRPNHHGHSLPVLLPGHMQHFATGFSLRPLELAWVVGWSGLGILGVTSAINSKRGKATQA